MSRRTVAELKQELKEVEAPLGPPTNLLESRTEICHRLVKKTLDDESKFDDLSEGAKKSHVDKILEKIHELAKTDEDAELCVNILEKISDIDGKVNELKTQIEKEKMRKKIDKALEENNRWESTLRKKLENSVNRAEKQLEDIKNSNRDESTMSKKKIAEAELNFARAKFNLYDGMILYDSRMEFLEEQTHGE